MYFRFIILCGLLSFSILSFGFNNPEKFIPDETKVSVFDFGVIGDGITDDSDAFQKAILYCIKNKKTLYIPRTSTNYKLNKTIRITLSSHEKIKIISNQAVIMPEIINNSSAYKLTAFNENVFLSIGRKMNSIDNFENLEELSDTSIEISGLIFDGIKEKYVERFSSHKQTIYIGAQLIAQSVKLNNCEFRNIQGYGLRIHEVSVSEVISCKFINVGGRGDTAFLNGIDFDAFGDAIYYAKVNKNAVITIEDCIFIGMKQKNKRSRSALTFEFSLFPYTINLKKLDIGGYAKCLHIEESAATVVKMEKVKMKDFNFGIANVLNDKTKIFLNNCILNVTLNDGNDAGDALAFLNYRSAAKIYVNNSILNFKGRPNAYQSAVGLTKVENSVINGNNTNFFFADGNISFSHCKFVNFGGAQVSFMSLNPKSLYLIEDSTFIGIPISSLKSYNARLVVKRSR